MLGVGVKSLFGGRAGVPCLCTSVIENVVYDIGFVIFQPFLASRLKETVKEFCFSYFFLVNKNVTQSHAYESTDGSWSYNSYPFATRH